MESDGELFFGGSSSRRTLTLGEPDTSTWLLMAHASFPECAIGSCDWGRGQRGEHQFFYACRSGWCMASGTTKRNANARDNQRANNLAPKMASEMNNKFQFSPDVKLILYFQIHVSNKTSKYLNWIFKLLVDSECPRQLKWERLNSLLIQFCI